MLDKMNLFCKKIVKNIFGNTFIEHNDIENTLIQLLDLNDVLAVSLIDWENNIILGTKIEGEFDIDVASKGAINVLKANKKMLKDIDTNSSLEDILMTLPTQIHFIHVLPKHPELCLYIVLDSHKSNVALMRTKVKLVAEELSIKYREIK
ncbi:MAG: hypothetical protein Q9M39_01580 [Sulfurovum sp.]|nr:hypothetical protein [Sulfurovum sp.]